MKAKMLKFQYTKKQRKHMRRVEKMADKFARKAVREMAKAPSDTHQALFHGLQEHLAFSLCDAALYHNTEIAIRKAGTE